MDETMDGVSDAVLWHDRKQWVAVTSFLGFFFDKYKEELGSVVEYARETGNRIDAINSFVQVSTAAVCPSCEKVCCINVHGYYDRNDLIFAYATGRSAPEYEGGLRDTEPCRFLRPDGCCLKRSSRPFRCNWYFCRNLLRHMETGAAKTYREFTNQLQELVDIRLLMLEEFFRSAGVLAPQEKGLALLYTKSVKS